MSLAALLVLHVTHVQDCMGELEVELAELLLKGLLVDATESAAELLLKGPRDAAELTVDLLLADAALSFAS
jgi:hypothetical protein